MRPPGPEPTPPDRARRRLRWAALGFVAAAVGIAGCMARPAVVSVETFGEPQRPPAAEVVELDLLTFNIAGLPGFVAKVDGRETHPQLGAALEPFDLVLLQEDFWYHHLIEATHPWQVRPRKGGLLRLGDGLARLSRLPLTEVEHVPWKRAHGLFGAMHDRWAWKGFSAGRLLLPGEREVWIYNVHFDAGYEDGDREARASQREQLRTYVEAHTPADAALILAGDFNTGAARLTELASALDLTDSQQGGIDRIFLRSGRDVELLIDPEAPRPVEALDRLARLSDHYPVYLRLRIALR
ncbi:MAG: endonuclease/exonuclease/phosphatase family protein [Planctomycetota bacterium]|jgi:endonuclease/exonuclease/phosphatase family metal-dependent hydrolase